MHEHKLITAQQLRSLIRSGKIQFAGNRVLKIYGTLGCYSGKKMKQDNRVFFVTEAEALGHKYRPCGNCMREAYGRWKNGRNMTNS